GNYPNPFNPSTTISYDVAEVSDVKLEIFDIGGRLVEKLESLQRLPGSYSVRWDGSARPSGTYFVRLEAGSFSDVETILLVK
ncbi:MAG: T9SS type A sorting domain-containing protein, partial [Rhodothermales bacterium]